MVYFLIYIVVNLKKFETNILFLYAQFDKEYHFKTGVWNGLYNSSSLQRQDALFG